MSNGNEIWMSILEEKQKRNKEQKGGGKSTKQRLRIAKEERPSRCGSFDRVRWSSDITQGDIIRAGNRRFSGKVRPEDRFREVKKKVGCRVVVIILLKCKAIRFTNARTIL